MEQKKAQPHSYETWETCGCNRGFGYCPVCDGGLSVCSVCGAYEGSLTTECPGRHLTCEEQDEVYAGRLDFRGGQWCIGCCSKNSPAWLHRGEEEGDTHKVQ